MILQYWGGKGTCVSKLGLMVYHISFNMVIWWSYLMIKVVTLSKGRSMRVLGMNGI